MKNLFIFFVSIILIGPSLVYADELDLNLTNLNFGCDPTDITGDCYDVSATGPIDGGLIDYEADAEEVISNSNEAIQEAVNSKVLPGGLVPCEGTGCGSCELVQLAKEILTWLIGVMLVIFAIITALAGFGLVTSGGNPVAKSDAKKKMTNAFVGIIIVLAAWLLVDTLLRALLPGGAGEVGGRPWSQIQCTTQATPTTPPAGSRTEPAPPITEGCEVMNINGNNVRISCRQQDSATPPYSSGCVMDGTPSVTTAIWNCDRTQISGGPINTDVRNTFFASENISVNKAECPTGVSYQNVPGGCTSVEGFNQATVAAITSMRQQCGSRCQNFTITGGSELGHSGSGPGTHAGGDKFDLRTADVNSYITGPDFVDGRDSGGRAGRVNTQTGVVCVREDSGTANDHWDCGRVI